MAAITEPGLCPALPLNQIDVVAAELPESVTLLHYSFFMDMEYDAANHRFM